MTRRVRKLALAALILVATPSIYAADIGTAFTYQGQLKQSGAPASGNLGMVFRLFDAATLGNQVGDPVTLNGVAVSNGLFTVMVNAAGEFGPSAFNGERRWLQITVDGTTLTPRQTLTTALSTVGLDAHSLDAADGDPADAVFVDNVGNVGVGTTSPTAQLDVNGAARTTTLEITGGAPLVPSLVGWGSNGNGQINIPVGTFIAVAAGAAHSLAIRSDGTLGGWGYNGSGAINVPLGTFTAVAAGYGHGLAIRSDGTLAGWGNNQLGQTDVPAGTFTAVAAGNNYSLAIRTNGTLAGWGNNDSGQITVPSGTFTAVAAGAFHSLAIRTNGTLVAWGCGAPYDYGQCNIPSGTFTAVAAGGYHSLAIRSDNTLVPWGCGAPYNLGQCNVPSGTFTAVAAGFYHSLAIPNDAPVLNPALRLHTDSALKPGSNTWTIFSDRRLKKNIEPLSGALERLLQLRGVTFQWLDPASQGGITGTQMGLIADEVQRAFPQWVGRDPKGYQTLTVGGFEALTAEALRELRQEKDAAVRKLQEENAELREMLKRVSERIVALEGGR